VVAVPVPPHERFGLAEVMERTGLPASTIHHYRRSGLLPPLHPGSSRRSYDGAHVEALLQIRSLRDVHGLSLERIADILPDVLAGTCGDAARRAAGGRARALEAATRQFSTRSYGEVTVADVAALAGIAKGSVYRHFSSKEDLFSAVVESLLATTAEQFAAVVRSAAGPDGVVRDRRAAAQAFAGVVTRAMPILLELGARAAKGHVPSQRLARRVLVTLAGAAGRPLTTAEGDPTAAGLGIIEQAFAEVLRWSVEGSWSGDASGA
jgi:AcrR family transcriptional regulator